MLELNKQQSLSFHSELYKLIPQDHLLIHIHQLIDFSFILEFVQEHYNLFYGRRAKDPEMLFRLIFIQKLYNLSDERVIEETKVNLAYKWFIGLNPEDPLPDPSLLSLFRVHKIGAGEVENLLTEVVKQCVSKGLIKSSAVLVDATHTHSKYEASKPLQVLKQAANRLQRAVKKHNNKLLKQLPKMPEFEGETREQEKQALAYLANLGETVEQLLPDAEGSLKSRLEETKKIVSDERLLAWKGVQSAIDPDARFGWKSATTSFFGYKESIAMTEDGIITAMKVEPGNASDPKAFPELMERTTGTGLVVQEVLADKAYGSFTNLKEDGITPTIKLNEMMLYGHQDEQREKFVYHKDSETVECPAGHHSIRKAKMGRKNGNECQRLTFFFDVEKCKQCPLQEGCYKPGTKSKTYSVPIVPEFKQKAVEYHESETFKQRYRMRYKIEQKNHELKNHHGLAFSQYSRGLLGMRIQAILTAIVVNAKRMVKLATPKMI
ncbi:IS1182 family transposase [Paenibacillus sp. ISL-20]|uniref:IS1182 family transposase n=1 Tax=Paenibacillus sp. ISL-20 TaxID=2819163 RepID=UPI002035D477|nr:IS1182 family transposase [Paenibacillus sp. ISL-20]